jgi:hypothetical protein
MEEGFTFPVHVSQADAAMSTPFMFPAMPGSAANAEGTSRPRKLKLKLKCKSRDAKAGVRSSLRCLGVRISLSYSAQFWLLRLHLSQARKMFQAC